MTQRSNWLFYCCFALFALILEGPVATLAQDGYTGPKKPTKLKVTTTYEPAWCHQKGAKKSRKNDELHVRYSASFFTDPDTIFDSNIGKPDPLKFTLGTGKVMPGWEQGMMKMCVGERRRLIIPGDLTFNGEPAIYTAELKALKRPTATPVPEGSAAADAGSAGKSEL